LSHNTGMKFKVCGRGDPACQMGNIGWTANLI
jgi:hypothetical protein